MEHESEPRKDRPESRFNTKAAIVLALLIVVGAVMYLKGREDASSDAGRVHVLASAKEIRTSAAVGVESETPPGKSALPRLVDLGAGQCVPCKLMAPILKDLRKEYEGKLEVVFIDVWKNPEVGREYGIGIIPTQIFYDAAGRELYRHEGFFSKEDILNKWKEYRIDLGEKQKGKKTE